MHKLGEGRLRKEFLDLRNTPQLEECFLARWPNLCIHSEMCNQVSRQDTTVKRQVESQHHRQLEDYGQVQLHAQLHEYTIMTSVFESLYFIPLSAPHLLVSAMQADLEKKA
jgi:hypothetical protein